MLDRRVAPADLADIEELQAAVRQRLPTSSPSWKLTGGLVDADVAGERITAIVMVDPDGKELCVLPPA